MSHGQKNRWVTTLLGLAGCLALLHVGCSESASRAMSGAMGKEGEDEWGAKADGGGGWGADAGMGEGEGEGQSAYCYSDRDCAANEQCLRGICRRTGGGDDPPPLPPEETGEAARAPVVGDRYLLLTIPGTSSIAAIDTHGDLLSALPLTVAGVPQALATLPGRDVAVVLGGRRQGQRATVATVVRAEGAGEPQLTEILLQPGFTALGSSASGFMVAYTDFDLLQGSDGAAEAEGNLSEVAVIDLREIDVTGAAPPVHHLSVGTRPTRVEFSEDGAWALVLTGEGVSRIDLAGLQGDGIAPPVRLHPDALVDPAGRRVILTPDGRWALAAHQGEKTVRLVDLAAPVPTGGQALELDAVPTDLQLLHAPGLADRLLVVLRDAHRVMLAPIPEGFTSPAANEVIELGDAVVGQAVVDDQARRALLFSTATQEGMLLVLDLTRAGEPAALETVRLDAPPRLVQLSPSGDAALVLHEPGGAIGFSLVSLRGMTYAKPFSTEQAAAGPFVFTPAETGPERLAIALYDEPSAHRELLVIPTESFIAHRVALRAPPAQVGVIGISKMVFVNQDDPEGLITFIHLEDGYATSDVARFRQNRRVD